MARIYMSPCFQTRDQTKRLTLIVLLAVVMVACFTLVITGLLTLTVYKAEVKGENSFNPSSLHYGIVIDCGSSGSRVYVYFWPPHSGNPHDLLNIQQLLDDEHKPVVKKVSPGLSEYETHPEDASEHIKRLLLFAQDYIPKSKYKETPLYILATAGMRMIPKEAQDAIMQDLHKDITKEFDFQVAENHFEVISGKTEGVYAWIAVNYALDRFSHDTDPDQQITIKLSDGNYHTRSRTVGMIDMGGGSVQIAFEVTEEELLKDIPKELMAEFNLGCQDSDIEHTYRVYVTTFLEYGANSAIERYQEALLGISNNTEKLRVSKKRKSVHDPCLPPGMPLTVEPEQGESQSLTGSGDYMECKARLEPLLNLSVSCQYKPCSMNGVHQPPIDFSQSSFYGFSEFWYTTEDVYRMGGPYKFSSFEKKAQEFCSTKWTQLKQWYDQKFYPKADDHRFKYECIKSAWMSVVLHKGFKFPESYSRFQSAQLIHDKDVQWTLGALIYRTRFLPLRDIQQSMPSHPAALTKARFFYNEYLIVVCFIVVLAAIFLYMKRLRLCPRAASISRVPSMSYFMTEENQMEQGVQYLKGQGYL